MAREGQLGLTGLASESDGNGVRRGHESWQLCSIFLLSRLVKNFCWTPALTLRNFDRCLDG